MVGPLLLSLALAQTPTSVRQTTTSGECLWWRDRTFTWALDTPGDPEIAGDAGLDAVNAALASWSAAVASCTGFTFSPATRVFDAGTWATGPPSNSIVFRLTKCSSVVPANDPCLTDDSCGNLYHCWSHTAGAVDLHTVTYVPSTGEILDIDVELNVPNFTFTTVDSPPCVAPNFNTSCVATDLQSVIASGTGFGLGLGHVSSPTSVMGSTFTPSTLRRAIDLDSANAVCAIYPLGQTARTCDGGAVDLNPPDSGAGGGGGSSTGGGNASGGGVGGAGGGNSSGGGGAVTCGPQNCAGCCDIAGVCQLGQADTACGAHGATCEQCAAAGSCSAGTCLARKGGCGCGALEGSMVLSALGLLLAARRRRH